ncbi:MAG: hypothetical protein Kow009_10790 [Spirochaetales bacterium]
MLHKVNYKTVLDYLFLSIQTLETGILSELDPDLFLDKILEDLLFIDAILSRIFQQLRDNPYLNRRTEYLYALQRTKEEFIRLTTRIVQQGRFLGEPLEPYLATFRTCLSGQMAELNTLRSILEESRAHSSLFDEEVVSPKEYQFLLAWDEEKEGV